MLAIRMQRTGRKGHAMFRVIVQDARRTPTSGKVVAQLGSYDPHAKTVTLNKEKASFYLEHGAQPSERAALLMKKEGVKLPDWVTLADKKKGEVRKPEKRRSTRPDEPAEPEAPAEEAPVETEASEGTETPAETSGEADVAQTTETPEPETAEVPAEPEAPATEEAQEAPAEEPEKSTERPSGDSSSEEAPAPAEESK